MERGRIEAGRDTEPASLAEDELEGWRGRVDVTGDDGRRGMGTDMDRQEGGRIGEGRRWRRGRAASARATRGESGAEAVEPGAEGVEGDAAGVGRTGRGSSPSGGSRRGWPTSRSRGTTEPWRGLRGLSNRPHLGLSPPRFVDAVYRTDTAVLGPRSPRPHRSPGRCDGRLPRSTVSSQGRNPFSPRPRSDSRHIPRRLE